MAFTAAAARALDRLNAIPLVTIVTMTGATLRFSDRVKTVGSVTYDDMLQDVGDITESVSRRDSSALAADLTVVLRNKGLSVGGTAFDALVTLHDTHPLNGAVITLSYIFLDGAEESAEELVFTGMTEEPQDITKISLSIRCGPVPEYRAKSFALSKLLSADYIKSLPSESGKCFAELIGRFHTVECRRTNWPVFDSDNETLLNGAITNSATTITVDNTNGFGDNADEEKIIWIEGERISWNKKTTTPQQFTGCVRGLTGGTAAAAHANNTPVYEHPDKYAEVTVAGHAILEPPEFYGEYADLLAPVPALLFTATPTRSYATFAKAALVVPPTLLDQIEVGSSGAPINQRDYSTQGAFYGPPNATSQAIKAWPANPYLNVDGVPQYSGLYLKVEWSINSASSIMPDSSGTHGMQHTSYGRLSFDYKGTNYPLGYGYTTWIRVGASSPYTYTVQSYSVVIYSSMASTFAKLLTNLNNWGSDITCRWVVTNEHCGFSAYMNIWYECTLNANAVTKTGTVKDEKYFRRIYASGWGRLADTTDYGTVDLEITRPDHVIKKWLVEKLGFSLSDIDTTSFNLAGTFYAAQSPAYELSVRVTDDKIDPVAEAYRMAFECRSVLFFALGKWYLRVIPTAAPAATRNVDVGDLAGEDAVFTCGSTPRDEVKNTINLRWYPNDGPTSEKDPFKRSITVADVVGSYPALPVDLELRMVYGDEQAMDVALIYLAQHQRIMKTISFPARWRNTDLQVGDTITISGMGFWEGTKFWIEGYSRDGVERAIFTAVEWW